MSPLRVTDSAFPQAWNDDPMEPEVRRITSALFVDFDNVFIGLRRLGEDAALAFARDPEAWLSGLEHGEDQDGPFARRMLVRNCYLNPSAFAEYRAPFTRAGFRVVDCPSLTQQGKSAADVNLVLDAIDALNGPTHYDEFFIASADADFTPLAIRCREANRRVTIIAGGPAARAYRAVADEVLLAENIGDLAATSTSLPTPVDGVLPGQDVPEAEAPARRAAKKAAKRAPAKKQASRRKTANPAAQAVLTLVREADGPVNAGTAARVARDADPSLDGSKWAGARQFSQWVQAELPDIEFSSQSPGWLLDPARFGVEDLPLQRQVQRLTVTPPLSRVQYGTLLTAIAEDVTAHDFERIETAKRVRDACQRAGVPVGRAAVNGVIQGLLYAGFAMDGPLKPTQVAQAWADNVISLCRGARMELTDAAVREIDDWVSGGLAPS